MTIDALQTWSEAGLTIELYPDKPALSAAAAGLVAGCIRQAIQERGQANVIFATGASQYDFLTAIRSISGIAWDRVTAFHLDEYLGLSEDHPASFRRYLRERLFSHLPFAEVHVLDGNAADAGQECARYSALLAERVIDVACIGVGENGHLAFNDPPADFETEALVHVVDLDEACRRQQVGEGHFAAVADVPPQALSLSIPAIMRAKTVSCVVPGQRKAAAIRCTLDGPVTPDCPGSVMRRHDNCYLYLDTASASLLARMAGGED